MAQPGSALQWGCRGRRFESGRPDRWKVNSLSALGLWGSFLFLELQYVAPIRRGVIGSDFLALGGAGRRESWAASLSAGAATESGSSWIRHAVTVRQRLMTALSYDASPWSWASPSVSSTADSASSTSTFGTGNAEFRIASTFPGMGVSASAAIRRPRTALDDPENSWHYAPPSIPSSAGYENTDVPHAIRVGVSLLTTAAPGGSPRT